MLTHPISDSNTIICLMGPTASGKTRLAIELTKQLPCSIISVDSSMVYRDMNIGTAKPTSEELALAPHRLTDICYPTESYSAGRFREDALREIENILSIGRIPLLVGGTMMYFKVLQQGLSDLPQANSEIRARLESEAIEYGVAFLHTKLTKIDPIAAMRIESNDKQRLERALELFELTGKTPTELYAQNQTQTLPYQVVNLALCPEDKNLLQERIIRRCDQMLTKGLIQEVENLRKHYVLNQDLPSMRAVGYRQVWQYIEGKIDHNTMREQIIIATRQLAKRQMTWLRSWQNLHWINCK